MDKTKQNDPRIVESNDKLTTYVKNFMMPLMRKIMPFCCGTIGDPIGPGQHIQLPTHKVIGENITLHNKNYLIRSPGTMLNDFDEEPDEDHAYLPSHQIYFKFKRNNVAITKILNDASDDVLDILHSVLYSSTIFHQASEFNNGIIAKNYLLPFHTTRRLWELDHPSEEIIDIILLMNDIRYQQLSSFHDMASTFLTNRIVDVCKLLSLSFDMFNLPQATLKDKIIIGNSLLPLYQEKCKILHQTGESLMRSLIPLDTLIQNYHQKWNRSITFDLGPIVFNTRKYQVKGSTLSNDVPGELPVQISIELERIYDTQLTFDLSYACLSSLKHYFESPNEENTLSYYIYIGKGELDANIFYSLNDRLNILRTISSAIPTMTNTLQKQIEESN